MPIDQSTQFDVATITRGSPARPSIPSSITIYLRSVADPVVGTGQRIPRAGRIVGDEVDGRTRWDLEDPEVAEVIRRIEAGTCELRYGNYPGVSLHELIHTEWVQHTVHPFAPHNIHLFFEHIAEFGEYVEATGRVLARFRFPGIVEGAKRTYYTRDDDAAAPDVRAVSALAAAGWTLGIPYGPHGLHAVEVLDAPDAVTVSPAERVYHRRKDQTAAIVAIARAWHRYWRGLTTAEQGINDRMTARKHVEHAIGRAWADRPNERQISVFYAGERTAERRDARDAEDWMLGNLEQWAHEWGFAALALALNTGANRSTLETELGDYTYCHINQDGTIGDKLSNGADGLLQATWDAYQDTHYGAAVNHGVQGLTVEALTIIVHRGDTETAQLPVTGGLAPHTFALAFPPTWASIDAATGVITVTPTDTTSIDDHTLRVKATDDLGTVVNADVTVTVRAANE